MIFFLLPLLFNPFNFIVNWFPALYLAAWPIIIQTLGRETLITHASVLIIFILTCDLTRQTMLKLIGFDLISFPLGLAILFGLTTDEGSLILSLLEPIFSSLLVFSEPIFLLIETYLVLDIVKSFNRWISKRANVRDEDSQDMSSWEPPLTRGAIIARLIVILLTSFSYFGVYLVIQEAKSLLGTSEDIPVNHAIAALVTIQLIAFSATIYKDGGILSESAMVALVASVPIFIASWSYYHLKESAQSQSSGLLGSLNTGLSQLLLALMSKLGLPLEKLAKYYFGPDFWYIVGARLACLSWWALRSFWEKLGRNDGQWSWSLSRRHKTLNNNNDPEQQSSLLLGEESRWLTLTSWLPKRTLIKVLIVLAYAQMLIQQMDNHYQLEAQASLLLTQDFTSSSALRSPIIQRLGQSMIIQVYYINSLVFSRDDESE